MSLDAQDALCTLSAFELARAYRAGELSPVEVVRAHLSRIDHYDAELGSYICVLADDALRSARAAERRHHDDRSLGELDGIPIGVKDNIDVAGAPTTGASSAMAQDPVRNDAPVVDRLRSAGAVLIGKHTLFELAAGGGPRIEGDFPIARNPWDLDHVPGGSSSGSAAAVAAGLASSSLGTDSGGSIRFPASLCGVVGLKPSAGVMPLAGIRTLSWSLDQVGPIARNVADARAILHVLVGAQAAAPVGSAIAVDWLRGKRIGVPDKLIASMADIEADILAVFRRSLALLEQAGAYVIPVEIPDCEYAAVIGRAILSAEASAIYGALARKDPRAFGSRFTFVLLQGALLSSDDYLNAQRGRAQLRKRIAAVMQTVDVIATPTSPVAAWPMADELATRHVRATPNRHLLTFIFNLTGQPAISVPCGQSERGLPIGLQLAGPHGADESLLTAAEAFEALRQWPLTAPWPGASGSVKSQGSRDRGLRSAAPASERRPRG